MENKGLIFIPDISGFTRFVNEMEINHSRLIIQELLEVLINSNELGLEVSEVEGDAILFYKFGKSPDLKVLYHQVERMFCDFQRNLVAYDYRRFCQCKACTSAIKLTLKVITHYGEFTDYQVKNFKKLIGKDIIVAHQLLKNNIEQHEYWLVTKNLVPDDMPEGLTTWMKWNSSSQQTETGEIVFHYTQLTPLKSEVTPELVPLPELEKKAKMLSLSREYETDIITLFHATGDFNYRSRWQEGVKKVEEVNHFLPRVGMRCRCIMENGEASIYASSYTFSTEQIAFSETDDATKSTVHYLLEKIDDHKTRLTIDYYIRRNIASEISFRLAKKKEMEQMYRKSMINIETLVKEIRLPAQDLSSLL
jgi:hypothetical protein